MTGVSYQIKIRGSKLVLGERKSYRETVAKVTELKKQGYDVYFETVYTPIYPVDPNPQKTKERCRKVYEKFGIAGGR